MKDSPKSSPFAGPLTRYSPFGFEETLNRLKLAIDAEGLWLLHEIDSQKLMMREGHRISPLRQLLFFHPRYLVRLLEGNPDALLEAPLRMIVHERIEGRVLLYLPPVAENYGRFPGLEQLGLELDNICQRVVTAVAS